MSSAPIQTLLAKCIREEGPRVVASLARRFRDVELAEECAQEAWLRALERWPDEGVPDSPYAWAKTVALRIALDRLRTEGRRAELRDAMHEPELAQQTHDERVLLLFACCHPAIEARHGVALAMRSLCGLSTAAIARAFLRTPEAMATQLRRSAEKIRESRIPFAVPPKDARRARAHGVLAAIYLVFNEGYSVAGRAVLSEQAIALGEQVAALLPEEPEAAALLALMILHHARRDGRFEDGVLVTLDQQDRGRWRQDEIARGVAILERAMQLRAPGPYQIQAAIAALHAQSSAEDTDWPQIAALYGLLLQHQPTPVVELNAAIAFAMSAGLEKGLDWLDNLDARGELRDYHLLPAARADLLARLGRTAEALAAYDRALAYDLDEGERRFLQGRRAAIGPAKKRRRRQRTRQQSVPLSDAAWARVAGCFPPRRRGRGRPPRPDREVLDAVLHVLCTGIPWRELPSAYGPWQTAYHRFRQWENDGTLAETMIRLRRRSSSANRAARNYRKANAGSETLR